MWKMLALASLIGLGVCAPADCPEDREYQCVEDFKKALPFCKKAAEAKGKDIAADLDCFKYAQIMEKDCWPCICYIA